jgi:hypothetical protein
MCHTTEFLKYSDHGQEQYGTGKIKYGIGIGDYTGIDRAVPKAVEQSNLMYGQNAHQDQDRLAYIKEDIYYTYSFGLRFGTYGTDNGRGNAITEVDTHDDGIDGLKGQKSRG